MRFCLTAIISLATFAGCDTSHSVTAAEEATEAAQATAKDRISDADSAWAEIVSEGEMAPRLSGENAFAHLMRDVELTNQRRRELGLAFWNAYPNDPRRYRWLMRAVHLEPYYPLDIEDWATREGIPEWNAAAVDSQARLAWAAAYPAMRETFWNNPDTTEWERRYLWYGELLNQLLNAPEASVRGEKVDGQVIADNILSFARRFPESFEPGDDLAYFVRVRDLWTGMQVYGPMLGLDKAELEAFTKALSAVSDATSGAISLISEGESFRQVTDGAEDLTEGDRAWLMLSHRVRTWMPGRISDGSYIFVHQRMIGFRRYLELGRQLWDLHSDSEYRTGWYERVLGQSPSLMFPRRIAESAALLAAVYDAGGDREREAARQVLETASSVDLEALRAWSTWRGSAPANLVGSVYEIKHGIWETQVECKESHDNSTMKRRLEDLVDLYKSETEHIDGLLISTVRNVRDGADEYCLSTEEAASFLSSIPALGDKRLTAIVEGPLAIHALRSTPLELSSPTWDGETFELSDLRGKIVLLQLWDTNCAACIAVIPNIKGVHSVYRDRGFDVVSINFDPEDQGRYVERIRQEYGLNWPILKAYEQWPDLNERFGWGYDLPQYMLLDREGLLVAYTPEIKFWKGGTLPTILDGLLATEAAEVRD